MYIVLCIVVWLWEGGTLWRAKWTRRGQKRAPSIYHTCRQRGTPQHKARCALSNFFFFLQPTAARAQEADCPGELSPSGTLSLLSILERYLWNLFPVKSCGCSWCVSAQTWAQSRRERERELEKSRQQGRREREGARGAVPCSFVWCGSLWGENLRGMLTHASP